MIKSGISGPKLRIPRCLGDFMYFWFRFSWGYFRVSIGVRVSLGGSFGVGLGLG